MMNSDAKESDPPDPDPAAEPRADEQYHEPLGALRLWAACSEKQSKRRRKPMKPIQTRLNRHGEPIIELFQHGDIVPVPLRHYHKQRRIEARLTPQKYDPNYYLINDY